MVAKYVREETEWFELQADTREANRVGNAHLPTYLAPCRTPRRVHESPAYLIAVEAATRSLSIAYYIASD